MECKTVAKNKTCKYRKDTGTMTTRTEKGQFSKGHSGNGAGKRKGSRNKATLLALEMFEGEAEVLGRKAIELALDGDTVALRLCLERIAPALKERPLEAFDMPIINSQKSALKALELVAKKLAEGELLPTESAAICKVLEQYRKHFETTELADRLATLERTLEERNK
jgi:hypothetical protein